LRIVTGSLVRLWCGCVRSLAGRHGEAITWAVASSRCQGRDCHGWVQPRNDRWIALFSV